eukprot:9987044-Ditylum_brightwellii.AAC.2
MPSAPQSKITYLINNVKIDAIAKIPSLHTNKNKPKQTSEPSARIKNALPYPKYTYHSTPIKYYNNQGKLLDPVVLFRSSSASSMPTAYYTTQGQTPNCSKKQCPPSDS